MNNLFTPLDVQAIKNPKGTTIAKKISSLEEQRSKVRELFSKIDLALAQEKITLEEYNYLLQNYAAGNHEHKLMQAIDKQISNLRANRDDYRAKANSTTNSLGGIVVSMMAIIMLLLAGTLLFNANSGITGFASYVDKVIKQSEQFIFTENGTIDFNATNITSLKITGTIKGLGSTNVYLLLGEEKLLVTSQSNVLNEQNSLLQTNKEIYLTGEEITANVLGATLKSELQLNEINSSNENNTNTTLTTYTLYAKSANKTTTLTSNNFVLENGEYELYALIDDAGEITKESAFIQVVNSLDDIQKEFVAVCDSTCVLDATKVPVKIQVEIENSTLVIDEIIYTTKIENSLPVQIKEFNDISLTQGMSTSINLDEHFTDADGQELLYDYSSLLQGLSIKNNILTINPTMTGSYNVTIYASDLAGMIESNVFAINVVSTIPQIIEENNTNNITDAVNNTNGTNNTNSTNESTIVEVIEEELVVNNVNNNNTNNNNTNITIDVNATNATVSELEELGLCSDPDVNNRPASCLIENSDYYFTEEGKYIENLDKKKVARITPIGNLLITGDLYENSVMNPGRRDFKLGYVDDNFEFVTTLWLDSKTGDLHLLGKLYEETINVDLPSNVYSFQNKRGVNLGYVMTSTGDLHIRGNLIPYRRSIE